MNDVDVHAGKDNWSMESDRGKGKIDAVALFEDVSKENVTLPNEVAERVESFALENVITLEKDNSAMDTVIQAEESMSPEQIKAPNRLMKLHDSAGFNITSVVDGEMVNNSAGNITNRSLIGEQVKGVFADNEEQLPTSIVTVEVTSSTVAGVQPRKKMKCEMPPKSVTTIDKMN
ncbi:hypothetical protein Nepgr_015537 [Nepenthes gracilis]|uniref:Uncharacterized protein n=1 Tax=Nepenthes gracilis TaxID=150966 RepID=A0AAD3XRD5_NEPGR|nr:hypothetical protein Nepgr_015537 [Nepenthes gracilis]